MSANNKWGCALQQLGLEGNDFGPTCHGTYAELANGWRGPDPLPDEATLEAAYATWQGRDVAQELIDEVFAGQSGLFLILKAQALYLASKIGDTPGQFKAGVKAEIEALLGP